MVDLDKQIARLNRAAELHKMPPTTPLSTDLAAIFLGVSKSTLENYRTKGGGPVYGQDVSPGAVGTNQKVTYLVRELLIWIEANQVSSSMEAAFRKGQLFETVTDLARVEPFWVDPATGRIDGNVLDSTIGTVIERAEEWEIIWLPVMEAASREWSNLSTHREFGDRVGKALDKEWNRLKSGLESTELGEGIA